MFSTAKLTFPPITRSTLALFAGASGDHTAIHIDIDEAKAAGLDDVIAHGMLVMAYAGRMLTRMRGVGPLQSFHVRFVAVTKVHDEITCLAEAKEIIEGTSGRSEIYSIRAFDQVGQVKISGEATFSIGGS